MIDIKYTYVQARRHDMRLTQRDLQFILEDQMRSKYIGHRCDDTTMAQANCDIAAHIAFFAEIGALRHGVKAEFAVPGCGGYSPYIVPQVIITEWPEYG